MSKRRKDDIIEALDNYYGNDDEYQDDDDDQTAPGCVEDVSSSSIVSMNAQLSSYRNLESKTADDKFITNISVSCGASAGNFPVVGKTVGAVSDFLREVLNIDRLSVGVVNGEEVEDDYVLMSNDSLEFLKAGGRKG
jgi:hypothetical protein